MKKITFNIPFLILLLFLTVLLGMDLMLLLRAVIENQEFKAFIYTGFTFTILIIVIIRVNLRKHKIP